MSVHALPLAVFMVVCTAVALWSFIFGRVLQKRARGQEVSDIRTTRLAAFFGALALVCTWYAGNAASGLGQKWIVSVWKGGFDFPITLAAVQALSNQLVVLIWHRFRGRTVAPPNSVVYITVIVPMAIASALNQALSAASLFYLDMTFFVVVKSTVLVGVLVCSLLMGLEKSTGTLWGTVIAINVGVGMAAAGDMAFNSKGFSFLVVAVIATALEWSLTQFFFQTAPENRDVFVVLYYKTPVNLFVLTVIALVFEADSINKSEFGQDSSQLWQAFGLCFLTGLFAILAVACRMQVVLMSSAVSMQILAALRDLVVFVVAAQTFSESLNMLNISGFVLALSASIYYRNYREKAREQEYVPVRQSASEFGFSDDVFSDTQRL